MRVKILACLLLLPLFANGTLAQDRMPSTEFEAAVWLVKDGNSITRNELGQVSKVVLDYIPSKFVVGDLDVFPHLETLHINYTGRFYDYHMSGIARLKNIKSFEVYHCSAFTDSALSVLRYLPKLESVVLNSCSSVYSLKSLVDCKSIKTIKFSENGHFDFDDLYPLKELENLESLSLRSNSSLEDQHLKLVAEIKSLKTLDLGGNKAITDEGIAHLASLKLRELKVDKCKLFTGSGLAELDESLESLEVENSGVTDKGVKELGRFKNLQRLVLKGNKKISNKELAKVGSLKKLVVLDLSGLPVDDGHFADFSGCESLKSVNLSGCQGISGKGLMQMADSKGLRVLDLSNCPRVGSSAIEVIGRFPKLRQLHVKGCSRIKPESLVHLANLKELDFIDLSECKRIGDSAIEHLSQVPSLKTVYLNQLTRLTDDSLRHLSRLPELTRLDISKNKKITAAGLDAFKDDCKLERLYLKELDKLTPEGLANISRFQNLTYLVINCKNLRNEHVLAMMGIPKLTYYDIDVLTKVDNTVTRRFRDSLPSHGR